MTISKTAKKQKTNKIKFRKVTFKLSDKQKKIIERFCKLHNTTPNKFYKKAIVEYLSSYSSLSPEDEYYISKNQLKLFDEEDDAEQECVTSMAAEPEAIGLFAMKD